MRPRGARPVVYATLTQRDRVYISLIGLHNPSPEPVTRARRFSIRHVERSAHTRPYPTAGFDISSFRTPASSPPACWSRLNYFLPTRPAIWKLKTPVTGRHPRGMSLAVILCTCRRLPMSTHGKRHVKLTPSTDFSIPHPPNKLNSTHIHSRIFRAIFSKTNVFVSDFWFTFITYYSVSIEAFIIVQFTI